MGFVYSFICLVAIGFALFFTLSIFFKVKTVEVTGTSVLSAEAVREAAQILPGDNPFLVSQTAVSRNVTKALSYVESVRVRRKLPSTIVIEVEESRALGALPYGGGYWLFAPGGKLLLHVNELTRPKDVPVVRGVTLLLPQEGAEMALSDADSDKQGPLLEVLLALEAGGLLANTQELDVTRVYDVRFTYDGRYQVVLGMPADLAYKLRFLEEVVAARSHNEKAAIDLSQVAERQPARVIVEG